jgi:hypothetical protein
MKTITRKVLCKKILKTRIKKALTKRIKKGLQRAHNPKVNSCKALAVATAQEHHCEVCGGIATIRYPQPMWTFEEFTTDKIKAYWACDKDSQEVFNSLPETWKPAFTISDRHLNQAVLISEVLIGEHWCKKVGPLALDFIRSNKFPEVITDPNYLEMHRKGNNEIFLVYRVADGKFLKKFKKHIDALDYYDSEKMCIVYRAEVIGPEPD